MDRVQQSQGDTVDLEDGDEELLDLIWDAFAHEEERDAEEGRTSTPTPSDDGEGEKSRPFRVYWNADMG